MAQRCCQCLGKATVVDHVYRSGKTTYKRCPHCIDHWTICHCDQTQRAPMPDPNLTDHAEKVAEKLSRIDCTHGDARDAAALIRAMAKEVQAWRKHSKLTAPPDDCSDAQDRYYDTKKDAEVVGEALDTLIKEHSRG